MRDRIRVVLLTVAAASVLACASRPAPPAASAAAVRTIVASIRAEPKSFNRYTARDLTSEVIARLMHAGLVRVDRVTDRLEPELAESWRLLPDGVTYRVALRRGVRFADGQPFGADDVAFSLHALYDTPGGVLLADSVMPGGKPLEVRVDDPFTVSLRFAAPFAPGLRVLDGVPILPRHLLDRTVANGTFASTWSTSTPPSELTGLGPFALREYVPGERLVFDRNPHYWRRDARGRALPAADRVVLEIVRDQNVEQLKLAAGEIDFTQSEVRPADYAALNRAKTQGRVEIADLGVGRDGDLLWFNLSRSKRGDLRSAWLQHADFRRAVSAAIDRDRFVNTVYFGAAVPAHGIVSPANRLWYAADAAAPPFDRAAVQRLLASLRLRDIGARLVDRTGAPVRFSLLTQKGNTSLERGAAFIRDSLADVGVQVDVVELEVGALVSRFSRGDYDAVYFRLVTTDTDPSLNPDFWRSSGDAHIWAPSQSSPATPWEGDIDRLIAQITAAPDADERHRLFAEVQRIVAREVPVLCFAFPRVWVATSVRVTGARPALVRPPILWDPAIVSVG